MQILSATLESRLAQLREQALCELPRLGELNERFFAELATEVVPAVVDVGARAPEIELANVVSGRSARLSWLLDDGPAVVTFYRGRWCPFSNLHLHGLLTVYEEVRALGGEILFVGPDTVAGARRLAEQWGGRVPVLADVRGEAMASYGVSYAIPDFLRPGYEHLGFPMTNPGTGWRLPITATFVIDRRGVVRARHVDPDYTRRMEPADAVRELRKIAGQ
jgi:peroxiredoxin